MRTGKSLIASMPSNASSSLLTGPGPQSGEEEGDFVRYFDRRAAVRWVKYRFNDRSMDLKLAAKNDYSDPKKH